MVKGVEYPVSSSLRKNILIKVFFWLTYVVGSAGTHDRIRRTLELLLHARFYAAIRRDVWDAETVGPVQGYGAHHFGR